MCESKVYVQEKGKRKLVMEEAAKLVFEGNKVKIYGILGNVEEVENCEADVFDLMKHEITLLKK